MIICELYERRKNDDMIKKTLPPQLFLCLIACQFLLAQKIPDSLKGKSFDYLNHKVDVNEADSVKSWLYLTACLHNAKAEKNNEHISKTYENMAYLSRPELNIPYADSMIIHGKEVNNKEFIAAGHIAKGSIYYSLKKYQKALDNYLLANTYAEKTNNDYLKYKVKYNVATIKFYLGFNDEAAILLKESAAYFKDVNTAGYINSLHALGLCYNKMGQYKLCTEVNNEGLKAATKANNNLDKNYFIHSEGINQYSLKNYSVAIQKLTMAIPALTEAGDFANQTVGYFYLGKCHLALKNTEQALIYFRKVDHAFTSKSYIRPDLRENYEILINHYKKQGDSKLQLHYIEKLLKADSVLTRNFKYISGKVHKEYDSHELELERKQLQNELNKKESTTYILYVTIGLLFFLTLFLLYRYYINQRTYRQKFEELMKKNETIAEKEQTISIEKEQNKKPDINPEVIDAILKQLENFEVKQKFLQKDLTLVNLSSVFNTNTNYLSKVINYSRNKNYINYLNDLRVDYIVDKLKKDNRFRNYTIKALAEEAGFSTAQHFSKAFFARTGIYPSYFVTELNRENAEAIT